MMGLKSELAYGAQGGTSLIGVSIAPGANLYVKAKVQAKKAAPGQ